MFEIFFYVVYEGFVFERGFVFVFFDVLDVGLKKRFFMIDVLNFCVCDFLY